MRLKRGSNNNRGWVFVFKDGYSFWAMSISGQERRREEFTHGPLIAQNPA